MEGGKERQPGSLKIDTDGESLETFKALGIDIQEGLRRVGGNRGRFVNLLRKFAVNQAATVSAIKTALASGERQEALDHLHTLKGVSANLGARDLEQAAGDLETAIKWNKTALGDSLVALSRTMDRLFAATAALAPARETGRSADPAQSSGPGNVPALARQLKRLLNESDTRSAEILEQLKGMVMEPVLKQRLQALDKPLANYDFEQALAVLDGIPDV
ncbi:MAG: Hpt domain-containing protein [Desulfobacteraceae bacterium]|nr:Hpt domain-containing protein [Desulfobacteraceae bacterium]